MGKEPKATKLLPCRAEEILARAKGKSNQSQRRSPVLLARNRKNCASIQMRMVGKRG